MLSWWWRFLTCLLVFAIRAADTGKCDDLVSRMNHADIREMEARLAVRKRALGRDNKRGSVGATSEMATDTDTDTDTNSTDTHATRRRNQVLFCGHTWHVAHPAQTTREAC